MNKKRLVIGISLVALVALAVTANWLARAQQQRVQATKQLAQEKSSLASFQKTEEWQKRAALFNKSKTEVTPFFNDATKFEAFRVFAKSDENFIGVLAGPGYYDKTFGYFSKVTVEDRKFATRLGEIASDAKTYSWPGKSNTLCSIKPAVTFRLWKNQQFVDMIVCFHCSQLVVMKNDEKVEVESFGGSLNGRYRVAGDFNVKRNELLALTKEAFPDDEAIQDIK